MGIGKDKVSKHLPKVKKKLADWTKDDREAAIVSLEEDICDGESYNMLPTMCAFFLDILVSAVMKLFGDANSVLFIVLIGLVIGVGIVLQWLHGRSKVYKYKGLLCLLRETDKSIDR